MQVQLLRATELSAEHRSLWQHWQGFNHHLASPYFCFEFIELTAKVRNDIFIGVVQQDKETSAFFPFQRQSRRHACPVAGPLSDYHGLITDDKTEIDAKELLRQCDLLSWQFDHLPSAQQVFLPYFENTAASPIIKLNDGFQAYREQRRSAGSKQLQTIERKRRKLIREIGPLRYQAHEPNKQVLEVLLAWKSNQCKRTGIIDIFGFAWTRQLLELMLNSQQKHFAGMLSTLYAGDELIAAHMGMRSGTVWHWWFPSYNDRFSAYSPGLILLLEMIKEAPARGLEIIDLGKDDSLYKRQFSNASISLAEGRVELPSLKQQLQQAVEGVGDWIRQTPLVVPARLPARLLRRYRRWRRFQ